MSPQLPLTGTRNKGKAPFKPGDLALWGESPPFCPDSQLHGNSGKICHVCYHRVPFILIAPQTQCGSATSVA